MAAVPKNSRGKHLTVDFIKDLGGNEDDLKLLDDVSDKSESEVENSDEDLDAEPIKKDEIKDFLKKLEIYKYRPVHEGEEKEPKKKKLLVAKTSEKSADEEEPSTSKVPEETQKKKTKEKNKYKVQHDEISSTTKDPTAEYKQHIKAYQKRKYLIIKGGEYFDNQADVENEKFNDDMVKQMEEFASKLLNDEIMVYNKQRESTKRSDVRWMKTVLSSGTLADKIAALTVLIQESPVHNLSHLDTLITMAKKKGRRENIQAIDALKEIFKTDLIPEDRKLRTFTQHGFVKLGPAAGWNKEVIDRKLIQWRFEAQLKTRYADFVKVLEGMAHDTVLSTKQKSVNIIYNMLVSKPEQEKMLLTLLINKVGDPHYKLASTVSHLLTKLVEHHPNMKVVVVREVERLLFRPNIADRAQYYSVCFLNQIRLSHDDKELAGKLIDIYLSFFKAFVKKGEVDSKMMSALLSGVNRAFPYSKLDEKFLGDKLEHLYKIVHIVNFSTSIQALSLLYQVMDAGQNISERYYSALYKKLVDPALKTSSKQAVFLNLLFKSMKKDESERRLKAFIKRLLQVCTHQQPPFTCGALVLLSKVLREKPGLLSLLHTEEESDDEEHFVDEPDDDDDNMETKPSVSADTAVNKEPVKKHKKASWVHRANLNHKTEKSDYDPYHRNPQYCHAENECIWELENFADHFHPTVALFAKQILKGELVKYTSDPLQDFTLIRFLDRFVYKNPKKKEEIEEKAVSMSRKQVIPEGIKGMLVTSDQFLQLDESKVPADDIFLHRYFQQKAVKADKKDQEEEDESDAESITDAEFDNFLDKYEGQLEGQDFVDVDFSNEFGRKKSKKGDEDDNDSDDELDDDLSDEEIDFEDDELAKEFRDEMEGGDSDDEFDDMGDDDGEEDDDDDDDEPGDFADADDYADEFASDEDQEGGFNEEDIEFSDNDDDFADFMPKGKKRKAGGEPKMAAKKGKKAKQDGDGGLYAAAEQFSSLMDDNAGSKMNMISSEALSNTDKADVKQLKWEVDRDRWLKGGNRNNFRKGGGKFAKKGGNKSGGKPWNKSGKQKAGGQHGKAGKQNKFKKGRN